MNCKISRQLIVYAQKQSSVFRVFSKGLEIDIKFNNKLQANEQDK